MKIALRCMARKVYARSRTDSGQIKAEHPERVPNDGSSMHDNDLLHVILLTTFACYIYTTIRTKYQAGMTALVNNCG